MRTLHVLTLALATSFASLAYADPGASAAPSADPMVQIQGAQSRYRLNVDEFKEEYRGRYLLASGKVLSVSNHKKRFYAQVEGQPAVEIVPVSRNVFVARHADMKLLFDEFRDGHMNDVVVTSRKG
jgi:hypothetical protein